MGGVFSSPKVEAAPVVDTSAKDRAAAEEKARREAQERQRRGLESNITGGFLKMMTTHCSAKNFWENNDDGSCRKTDRALSKSVGA